MVVPSFFLGLLLAVLTLTFGYFLTRKTKVQRPLPWALITGLTFGTLGAYPYSLIWTFSELRLGSVPAFWAGYAYLALAMGGYVFYRERRALRKGNTEQLSV